MADPQLLSADPQAGVGQPSAEGFLSPDPTAGLTSRPAPIEARGFTQPESVRVTSSETTTLSPADETQFRQWATKNGVTDVDHPDSHYDYRGYWKDTQGAAHEPGQHFPDTYKQHGHPTFSVESKYSTGPGDGGRWDGDRFVPAAQDAVTAHTFYTPTPLSNTVAEGARQVVSGAKGAVTPPTSTVPGGYFNPKTGTRGHVAPPEESIQHANDLIEGVFKLATPVVLVTGAMSPLATVSGLIKTYLASKVGEKAAAVVGASPEAQRLAGNMAAAASGVVSAREIYGKLAADAHAVVEQARAFDAAHPEMSEQPPKPVGRGYAEGAKRPTAIPAEAPPQPPSPETPEPVAPVPAPRRAPIDDVVTDLARATAEGNIPGRKTALAELKSRGIDEDEADARAATVQPSTASAEPPPATAAPLPAVGDSMTLTTRATRPILDAISSTGADDAYVIAGGQRLKVQQSNYGMFGRAIAGDIRLADGSEISVNHVDRVENSTGDVLWSRPSADISPKSAPLPAVGDEVPAVQDLGPIPEEPAHAVETREQPDSRVVEHQGTEGERTPAEASGGDRAVGSPSPTDEAVATEKPQGQNAIEDEIRTIMRLDGPTIEAYRPDANVQKSGRAWIYRTTDGNLSDARFDTKREAVAAAERHQQLKLDQFKDPTHYYDIVRLRAGERLQKLRAYMADGLSEMAAAEKVRAEDARHAADITPPQKFSSTQVQLPPDVGRVMAAMGAKIPARDLAEDGRETDPHVTVKYGLHTIDPQDVRAVLADEPPIRVTMGKTSIFVAKAGGDADVVKIDVDSPDLHRLNAKIAEALKTTDTHPTYKPHATIAYVKAGRGKRYAGKANLAGRSVVIDRITFSGSDGQSIEIPLAGTKTALPSVPVGPIVGSRDDESLQNGAPGAGIRAAEAGPEPDSGSAAGPRGKPLSRVRQREADIIDGLVQYAARSGYVGDPGPLTQALRDRAQLVRELNAEADAQGAGPQALIHAIIKAGGISETKETSQQGEIRWLKQSALGKRSGLFRNAGGLPLDSVVEAITQQGGFPHIETLNDLVDELTEIAASGGTQREVTPKELGAVGERWWERILPTPPADEQQPAPAHQAEALAYQRAAVVPMVSEDWGARERGGGKRGGGTVRGAMSDAPTGIKHYPDFEHADGVTAEAWQEIRLLEDEDKRIAIGALQAGRSLDDAMHLAYGVEPKTDTNEFGEEQARLPEAGAVRDAEQPTPEFDVPFSLDAEVDRSAREFDQSLFGDERQPGDEDEEPKKANGKGITLQSTILPGAAEAGEAIEAAARRIVGDVKSDRNLMLQLWAPAKASPLAEAGAATIRANIAARDQRAERARRTMRKIEKMMDRWSHQQSIDFWNVMEGQAPLATVPESVRPIVHLFRDLLDRKRTAVIERGLLHSYLEDYWPHEWVRGSSTAESAIRKLFGRRPIQGPESYRKQRKIPTMAEGLDLGLEPVSWNPTTQLLRKMVEMDKSIAAHDIMQDLKRQGLRKFVPANQAPKRVVPEHWERYPDNAMGTVYGPKQITVVDALGEPQGRGAPEFGRLVAGHYYGPPEVVRLIKNHLSPGLTGKSKLFDLYRTAGNFLNQMQLGFSAFHLMLTGMEAVVSKQALVFELLSRGQFESAAKKQLEVPIAPFVDLVKGHQALKAFYADDATADVMSGLIKDVMTAGGAGFGWSMFEHDGAPAQFMANLRGMVGAAERGDYGTAAMKLFSAQMKAVPALIELQAKPIMEGWVPRLKAAAYMDMALMELERLGPKPNLDEARKVLGQVWDSVDNRFGQLRYDNLFWDNTFKHLLMGSVRAVGWNVGTLREMIGAIPAQIGRTADNLTGGGSGGAGSPPRGGSSAAAGASGSAPQVGSSSEPWLHRKMAWFIAMLFVHGLAASIYMYLRTGHGPQEAKDYAYPRTGEVDPSTGRERRVSFPDYFKDLYGWLTHPLSTASHKLQPLLTMGYEWLTNEDYFGTALRDPSDPIGKQLVDLFTFLKQQYRPFTLDNFKQRARSGQSALETGLGVSPAPASVERTALETYLHDVAPPVHRTQEEAAKAEVRREVRSHLQKGDTGGAVQIARNGGLSAASLRATLRSARQGYLKTAFARTSWPQAIHAYEVATPTERAGLQSELLRKVGSALASAPPAERAAILAQRADALRLPTH